MIVSCQLLVKFIYRMMSGIRHTFLRAAPLPVLKVYLPECGVLTNQILSSYLLCPVLNAWAH